MQELYFTKINVDVPDHRMSCNERYDVRDENDNYEMTKHNNKK